MYISATPTVYKDFYSALASASGDLRRAFDKACLYNSSGVAIEGSEVFIDTTSTEGRLTVGVSDEKLTVTYFNSASFSSPAGLRVFYYDVATQTDILLLDFAFDDITSTPLWGLWSFSFDIKFSACDYVPDAPVWK